MEWKAWQQLVPHDGHWYSFFTYAETSNRSPYSPDCKSHKTLGEQDSERAFPSVNIHPVQRHAALDDPLDVPYPTVRTVSPAKLNKAEELDFENTKSILCLKRNNFKICMFLGFVSNILGPLVKVFDTETGLNLIRTSFRPVDWHDRISSIHNKPPRSDSSIPVHEMGRDMIFVLLGDLHVRVPFRVIDILQNYNFSKHLSSKGLSREFTPWNDTFSPSGLAQSQ